MDGGTLFYLGGHVPREYNAILATCSWSRGPSLRGSRKRYDIKDSYGIYFFLEDSADLCGNPSS